jgi:hypothetical protein
MADGGLGGGMDPCECVWSHEMAMQRLMNLLRNSQSFCTDNECIQDGPGALNPGAAAGYSTLMLVMFGWIIMATALFLLRPASLRRSPDSKPAPNSAGNDDDQPPAPPIQ